MLLLVLAAAAMPGAVFLAGLNDLVQDPRRFVETIRDAGASGPLIYVILMAWTVGIGLPGVLFVVPASILWPTPTAIAVYLAGGLLASCLRFAFVRSAGRSWVEARLPERFKRWDDRLSRRGFPTVVVLRLMFNLAAPADWVIALSRVTTTQFLTGTIVGRTPVAVVLMFAGGRFFNF